MSWRPPLGLVASIALAVLAGCHPQEPFYMKRVDNDLAHYKGVATEIDYPDVDTVDRLADVANAAPPPSLQNNKEREVWNLTLEEAIQIALRNNKVMRNIGGSVQGPPDFILRNPELAPTIYDPALAESNPRTGPEAALAAFDTEFTNSLTWQKIDSPQNVSEVYADLYNYVNQGDQAVFQTKLQKVAATGGTFALTHEVDYALSNSQTVAYAADWNVKLVAEMRQPLLQGAGVQFNRIAGPGATPGVYNGVMVARISTDIALADFEAGVRNLVSDVETAYWELYFNYRSLDAVIAGRDSALQTWRKIYTLYQNGSKGGEAEKEAQAREQYYLFRSTAEQSLNALYVTEGKLRYLLGLAAADNRLIRPKDEPTTAKLTFNWYDVLNEGLVRNVELRQEKWIIKRRELELIAAKNFLLPKLDFVAQYRWLGLGNYLFPVENGTGSDFTQTRSNAYQSMWSGEFQEWQSGFVMSLPLGFRRELAGVRNAQLTLTRERAKLREGELELSHQLAYAIRDLETNYVLSQTDFNRRIAAQRQVEAVAAAYETDTITLDVLLNAQQQLAQAESDYFRALVNYNRSISQVHYRKGSLLEYNGVYLAEGPWPAKAYFDARRRARARDASTPLDYGFTQPKVISRGPFEQHVGDTSIFGEGEPKAKETTPASPIAPKSSKQTPSQSEPELVPTPEPQPIDPGELPKEPAAGDSRASTTKGNGDWTTKTKGRHHEPGANSSAAADDWSASGWQGVQR